MLSNLVFALAVAVAPLVRCEVPQEHSHEVLIVATRAVLNKGGNNDPFVRKVDAVFGTLGLAANIKNFEQNADLPADLKDAVCVQQNLADACIDNAKKNGGDKNETATCMQFRVLERNTNGVGLAQDVCKKAPRNAELAGLTQITLSSSASRPTRLPTSLCRRRRLFPASSATRLRAATLVTTSP
ncbi:hypothetical protein BC831DRAFT_188326 [Entophlyctis helioformis]|nr:hypothetical protein BC831DRAFT_188326 [Entophlyctis helioformis]